uniref:Protein FAR1-RELATED SEQUENCE n=1 Tax=Setaria viridis TaxID=4556 RepID=A0A4U6UGU5_SETVI|nr:hypothetical protein SEVIR_5G177560v2 [Setaria viridis]
MKFADRDSDYIINPVVGTKFDDINEAFQYYNLYSWECRFGIRTNCPAKLRLGRTSDHGWILVEHNFNHELSETYGVFLGKMDNDDPGFKYIFEPDKDGRIKTLMWTNTRSHLQYEHFGDVITFYTTYKTNLYEMPFGMFVGVNNHFQSVLLGGGGSSFRWIFKEFTKLIGGKELETILTGTF